VDSNFTNRFLIIIALGKSTWNIDNISPRTIS